MSLLTFLCHAPNNSEGQYFSRFLNQMQVRYNIKDFYYFNMGQKIFCSRQGFTWLNDSNNWKSIGCSLITLYACYELYPEAAYQFNYNTKNFPNSPIYFMPYNFFSYGLIFTENSNYSKLANNEMSKIFCNGTIVISYINESVEPEPFSAPSPIGIYDEDAGIFYGPQTSTDNNFLWFTNYGYAYVQIIYDNVYDQLIVFPYKGIDVGTLTHRFTTPTTLRYFKPQEFFGPLNGSFKYFLVNFIRSYMSQPFLGALPWINFSPNDTPITNIFAAQNPLCGNSTLSSYPFMDDIPAIKIFWNTLNYGVFDGTLERIVDNQNGANRYYHYVSTFVNTNPDSSLLLIWYMPTELAPNRVFNNDPKLGWLASTPGNATYNGIPCTSFNITNEAYICWNSNLVDYNANWDFVYMPAKSPNPKHVFFKKFSDLRIPSLVSPNCLKEAITAVQNVPNPDNQAFGNANAPSLYLPYFYGALTFANYDYIQDYSAAIVNNRYFENYTTNEISQKYIQDQLVQTQLSGLQSGTVGYDIESDPMQNGMRFFKQGLDLKKYYRFINFPTQILAIKIDATRFEYDNASGMYTYPKRFSFPQNFPTFKYASMFVIGFNYIYFKNVDKPKFYLPEDDNTSIVMYSDLTRKIRSDMVPLLVINDKYINHSFGEIFSSKDFGIYFRTNNKVLNLEAFPNTVYFYLS